MNTYRVCIEGRQDVSVNAYSFAVIEGNLVFYDGTAQIAAFSLWRSVTTIEDKTKSADQNE